MIIGNIKEYNICEINENNIEKDGILTELQKIENNIKDIMLEVLKNKGLIYGLKKENVLNIVYIFETIKEDDKEVLKLKKVVRIKDIDDDIIKEFEDCIVKELDCLVAEGEIEKCIFNDIEISHNGEVLSRSTYLIWICIGLVLGYGFGRPLVGLLFGSLIGLIFGGKIKVKRTKKVKKEDN